MKLILGSSSPYRAHILNEFGVSYETISPSIDEKALRSDDPEDLVRKIAHAKIDALAIKVVGPAIIIAGDTIVLWNEQVREKPETRDQAREFIKSYSEHPAIVINCVVSLNTETGQRREFVTAMHSWYLPIPEDILDLLVMSDDTMHTCGAFLFEHPLMQKFMIHTDGSEDIAFGLPRRVVKEILESEKII